MKIKKIYDTSVITLAGISIILVIFDFASIINLSKAPYLQIDSVILGIFAIDYLCRLIVAKEKMTFFKQNIFDLIAIIPFNSLFSFFRFSRIFRITKLSKFARLGRLAGFTGKLKKNLERFLQTNGFIYLIYISIFLLLFSSILYSIAENASMSEALWWAVATTTTVGYGDISPVTPLGKFSAVILMFLGIGIIGMLTSTITGFFTKKEDDSQVLRENQELHEKLDLLLEKVEALERQQNQE